jgi:hypothetical protein
LEDTVRQGLICNGDIGIVANDLVKDGLVCELIDLSIVGNVCTLVELLTRERFASIQEVGHLAGVKGPVVSGSLQSLSSLSINGLGCTCSGRKRSRDWNEWSKLSLISCSIKLWLWIGQLWETIRSICCGCWIDHQYT